MAYSVTSAANPKALLAAIITFATAQGWTIDYDHANGSGSSFGGQIALHSGNCFVTLGEASASVNPVAVSGAGGSFNDGQLGGSLNTANIASVQYWGHTGNIVASAVSENRIAINDVWGPMDEVHFFGDIDHIVCAVKCSAQRWTMFSFGNLNVLGMSAAPCGYFLSNFFEYWNTNGGTARNVCLGGPNNLFWNHSWGAWDGLGNPGAGLLINTPAGLLDSSFGFNATNRIIRKGEFPNPVLGNGILPIGYAVTRVDENNDTGFGSFILDHVVQLRAQPTTGGIPLFAVPIHAFDAAIQLHSFVGEIPSIRICRIPTNSPGDTITYGSENYMVFPMKRKGTVQDSGSGGVYDNQPNTYDLAYAIKKVV